MMQPPKHVLLELDEEGDLHSVDGDSDALVNDRSKASASARLFEARRVAAAAPVCDRPSRRIKCVEGACQKANGNWTNHEMFPGREFDDLDAYRAAKKQRKEQRKEYIAQTRHNMYS